MTILTNEIGKCSSCGKDCSIYISDSAIEKTHCYRCDTKKQLQTEDEIIENTEMVDEKGNVKYKGKEAMSYLEGFNAGYAKGVSVIDEMKEYIEKIKQITHGLNDIIDKFNE